MKSDVFSELLARSPLFDGLPAEQLSELYALFEREFVVAGQYLMRAGDPSDALYLVLSGRLLVMVDDAEEGERLMMEVTRGETLGEMGMVTGEPRSASVLAARDCELARLSKAHFDALVERHPGVLMHITKILVERLRQAGRPPGARVFRTLAVLPAGSATPSGDFLDRFLDVLAREGRVLRLDRRSFDEALGSGAADDDVDVWDDTDARTADWLSDRETEYRFLVFEAEPEVNAWTRRCLRQADRVLLVGRADSSPSLLPAERHLVERLGTDYRTPLDLVLLHPDPATSPVGTAAWLAERPVSRHHHVHLETPGHLERVVRFLTNRAVGVVLGGGGSRGSAHIGVLQALRDAGIPIDMIGGTSSGAGVGAQYAMGLEMDEIRDMTHERLVVNNPFKKATLPVFHLVDRDAVDRTCQLMYRDFQVEDLWIPYFCVSCNLSTGTTVIHGSGPLWKAVRASTALPGILAPMVDGRHVLVDGGVVDNVPVTEMKRLNAGPAIVVNVSPDVDLELTQPAEAYPSPWAYVRSKLNPFAASLDAPTLISIVMRTVLINSIARKKQTLALADVFLDPPVAGFGLMNPEDLDDLIAIGYEYTRQEVARLLADPSMVRRLSVDAPEAFTKPGVEVAVA